ncbi:ORF6C domain-containing protein [Clostridium saccharoperbutylacetonicum]|uniref:ORF6C domain-containing protein n=1 Tax=Clostridium saccharoperbutylacetonicum TaxID=36745 RepID=UPI0039E8E76A
MKELIKLNTSEGGKKTVSAKELYLGLDLNEKNWSRWYPTNITNNEFFREGYDWRRVGYILEGSLHNDENSKGGRPSIDFEISLEFAKHIAMMARTEKSHQFRNYFLMCEAKLKEQQNMIGIKLSPMEILETQFKALKEQKEEIEGVKKKVDKVSNNFEEYKENSPLFNVECDELQKALQAKGVQILGGKSSQAYQDKSLRTKLYTDIQREIKRQFQIHSYKALKRSQLSIALEIIDKYSAPLVVQDEIVLTNNQIEMGCK